MTITLHRDLIQKSDEWREVRRGLLTASDMDKVITAAKLQPAKNATARSHMMELLAQRFTGFIEEQYVSFDMMRGEADEIEARQLYADNYAPVEQVGFITNDEWGFVLGFSPDGLVGEDGIIEIKSRCQKYQTETIISGKMPDDFKLQVQTGLLVSGRKWCDFISYCAGMPMVTIRVNADPVVQAAVVEAARSFYTDLLASMEAMQAAINDGGLRLLETQRRAEEIQ